MCVSILLIYSSVWTLESAWSSIKSPLLFPFSLWFNSGTKYIYIIFSLPIWKHTNYLYLLCSVLCSTVKSHFIPYFKKFWNFVLFFPLFFYLLIVINSTKLAYLSSISPPNCTIVWVLWLFSSYTYIFKGTLIYAFIFYPHISQIL